MGEVVVFGDFFVLKKTGSCVSSGFIDLYYSLVEVYGKEFISRRIWRPSYDAFISVHDAVYDAVSLFELIIVLLEGRVEAQEQALKATALFV